MKLGLLGPLSGDRAELKRAALGMRDIVGAERVMYLGADSALDEVVRQMAEDLVGPDVSDSTLMARATERCLHAQKIEIFDFIDRERKRAALRMFECLAGEATRSVELIAGKVAVMLYDKAALVEDDILPATLLIFGRSREALIKQVGRRWFLSPGRLPKDGMMVLEDNDGEIQAKVLNQDFSVRLSFELEAPRALRMRAVGGS